MFRFFLASVLFIQAAVAQPLPDSVSSALARAGIPASAAGIVVSEVHSGERILSSHPDKAFNPASVMKLLTTSAALDTLGAAYTWKTGVYTDGVVSNGRLEGNLYFRGGGDPRLVVEHFWLLLRQLRARGIRDIGGDVVVDRSLFAHDDDSAFDFDGDPQKPYNANPDAMLLNFKAIAFRFLPDPEGGVVRVTTEPAIAYEVRGPAVGKGACGDWKSGLRAEFEENRAVFAGSYPLSCGEQVWYVHPYRMKPMSYFSRVFRQMWQESGGQFTGEIAEGTIPDNATLLTEWESAPLAEAIRGINKFSNNVMARQLLLTMVAEQGARPASSGEGQQVLRQWLAGKGIAASALVVENGSGLSRRERMTAAMMGDVLLQAYRSPTMPELMSSMPIVGVDGTMKRRMKGEGIVGSAHIKTGMLDDVRAVAGYVSSTSGKRYVVVGLINHPLARRSQPVLDALLQWVHTQ